MNGTPVAAQRLTKEAAQHVFYQLLVSEGLPAQQFQQQLQNVTLKLYGIGGLVAVECNSELDVYFQRMAAQRQRQPQPVPAPVPAAQQPMFSAPIAQHAPQVIPQPVASGVIQQPPQPVPVAAPMMPGAADNPPSLTAGPVAPVELQ